MLITLIFIILVVILYIFDYWDSDSLYVPVFLIAMGIFIPLVIGKFLPTQEIIEVQEICALSDSSSANGRHFLLLEYVEEQPVYCYVIETEKGKVVKELKGVSARDVYIKEGKYTPSLVTHKIQFVSGWHYIFAYSSGENYKEFLLPENSVTTDFESKTEK